MFFDEILNGNFQQNFQLKQLKIPILNQINSEKEGRHYILETDIEKQNKYYSVTTMLGDDPKKEKSLEKWRNRIGRKEAEKITKFSASRGTKLHNTFENYLNNEDIILSDIPPHVRELFLIGKKHLDENVSSVYCLEQRLYSQRLGLAGTVDGIIEWKRKLSVIDFKTARKLKRKEWIFDYFLQCSAYALMLKEITNISIDQMIVFITVEGHKAPQIFIESVNKYIPFLLKRTYEFYKRNDLSLPQIFCNTLKQNIS
jgi:genome maintenance exonuclease 1